MKLNTNEEIIRKANSILRMAGSRSPERICHYLGIHLYETPLKRQKGVYKVIEKRRCIFIKNDLDPVMRNIVLWHEIGHDQLHRKEATQFREFNLFDMTTNRMEYEANLFAAQIGLDEDLLWDYIMQGWDDVSIARALDSDINLVALKVSTMSRAEYNLRIPEHRNDFLK